MQKTCVGSKSVHDLWNNRGLKIVRSLISDAENHSCSDLGGFFQAFSRAGTLLNVVRAARQWSDNSCRKITFSVHESKCFFETTVKLNTVEGKHPVIFLNS